MAILKKGQQYLQLWKSYFDNYEFRIYECDKEPNFEYETKDWNNDGNVYTRYGIDLKTIEGYGTYQWIDESEFNFTFYEYKEISEKLIFIHNKSKNRFKVICEVKHKGIDFVGISNDYGFKSIAKKSDGIIELG